MIGTIRLLPLYTICLTRLLSQTNGGGNGIPAAAPTAKGNPIVHIVALSGAVGMADGLPVPSSVEFEWSTDASSVLIEIAVQRGACHRAIRSVTH
jgi:hypothetical protein